MSKYVVITAGHSNQDSGAVGKDKNGKQVKEADVAVVLRNAIAFYLKDVGITVKTDGVGTNNDPLSSAIKLIKGSALAVEIHLNASANPTAIGIETISLPKDKKISQDISKAIQKVTGSRLRGDQGWIDQSMSARGKLGYVSNGGLIVEVGFLSNISELHLIQSKAWLIAKEITNVIIDYVNSK